MSKKEFPTQDILELACAAQRTNNEYLKELEWVYDSEGKPVYIKHSNKMLMLCTVDHTLWTADPKDSPMPLKVIDEDKVLAEEIKKHFRKFMFSAIAGENDFQTNVNTILSSENIKPNQFGYVACLPSVYVRDLKQTKVKKAAKTVDEGYLGDIDSWLTDLDAEIISSVKSKNFEGHNIDAIINNKMASWVSKTELKLGPAVIIKAKVKGFHKHWKHENDVTRLNYVKVAQ